MNENKEFECQQIQKMLEYQDVDKKYVDLNEKVTKSKTAMDLVKAQNERKRAIEEVVRINTLTEELYKNFETIFAQYEDVKTQINDSNTCIENEQENLESADFYVKTLEKCDAMIDSIQEQLDQLVSELNHKRVEYKTEMQCAANAASAEKKLQEEFATLKSENLQEAKEIHAQLKALRAEITDEDLFNAYQEAKKRGIKRILVPYRSSGDLHVCGGCGVEVNTNVRAELESGATRVECPNCGRIIYNIEK